MQVVVNLLNNAAKYTPQGGEIALRWSVGRRKPASAVRDNGSGIAPALLPHVFDLFIQGERTPDRAQGGLGLGLALVKSIAALHGGQRAGGQRRAWARAARFTITLPAVARAGAGATAPPAPARRARRRRRASMIVDDNVDAAQSLGARC